MISVIKTDKKSARGLRNVLDGNLELFKGFEFNENGKLSNTLIAPHTSAINRETGEMKITIPSFIPEGMISAPPAATHFRLISGGSALDFENKKPEVSLDSTEEFPLNNVATREIVLNTKVPPNSTHTLFLALGIEFYQEMNKVMYRLMDESFNALAMVKVSPR